MTNGVFKKNATTVHTQAKYFALPSLPEYFPRKNTTANDFVLTKNNSRFLIRTVKEVFVINFDEVVCCIADNNYTTIHLTDGTKVMASKTLKDFETILYPAHFFRIHSSIIINMNFIKRIRKAHLYAVELTNHVILNVARSKQKELLLRLMTI